MEILITIGFIFFLVVGLVIWRLRVKQQQDEEDHIWTAAMHQMAGEPWPWPKGDK
jgi:hypothetical protein